MRRIKRPRWRACTSHPSPVLPYHTPLLTAIIQT
jgi:hypothetical protein